jgi:predicted oxidoreductase (fatty acid repression mutant protein)
MRQLAKQYNWLAGKCAKISEENQQHIKDHFWSILRKLLVGNGVNHYTPSVILQLQNTVWKTMKRAYA